MYSSLKYINIFFITAACFFKTDASECLGRIQNKVSEARNFVNTNALNRVEMDNFHRDKVDPLMHMTDNTFRTHFKDVLKYNGHTYTMSTFSADRDYAHLMCPIFGGYPVEINDDAEWNSMKNFMIKNNIPTAYIGVDDTDRNKQFHFTYSGTPAFTKFASGQPDDSWGEAVILNKNMGYLMDDILGLFWSHHICEIPGLN